MSHVSQVLWAALAVGLVFGVVGQRTRFCLTGGLRDWLLDGDGRRIRAFALAAAVAVAGAQTLELTGVVGLGRSLYLQPQFSWLLFLFGGALFGYGMILANGCGARSLVLLGSGNLRSFVVLLCLGMGAYMVLSGLLAPLRLWLAGLTSVAPGVAPPSLHGLFAQGLSSGVARGLAASVVVLPLLLFAVGNRAFRGSVRDWLGGLMIGALIPAGWFVTGWLGADDFEPVRLVSLTFVAPIGDSMQYVMLSTGTALDFGVVVVAGVLAGALLASVLSGNFRLEGFTTPQRMLRSMAGGLLMGVGGGLALGCSIGQGLTGLSTLALGSFLAVAGILLGAVLGLRGPLRLPSL
ncbi:MAG: YeeE/YedE family protein [Ectothiorhodospiraceae bacterium]|nr:YeeE/YedE family protein [Ectothiorhodospiraceae bacterium]